MRAVCYTVDRADKAAHRPQKPSGKALCGSQRFREVSETSQKRPRGFSSKTSCGCFRENLRGEQSAEVRRFKPHNKAERSMEWVATQSESCVCAPHKDCRSSREVMQTGLLASGTLHDSRLTRQARCLPCSVPLWGRGALLQSELLLHGPVFAGEAPARGSARVAALLRADRGIGGGPAEGGTPLPSAASQKKELDSLPPTWSTQRRGC